MEKSLETLHTAQLILNFMADLTIVQLKKIAVEYPEKSSSELAAEIGCVKGKISGALYRLRKMGAKIPKKKQLYRDAIMQLKKEAPKLFR